MKSSFTRTATQKVALTFVLSSILILAGCSNTNKSSELPLSDKTNEELVSQYQGKIDDLRTSLKSIYQAVSDSKEKDSKNPLKNLSPIPDTNTEDSSNTECITLQELSDPDEYFTNFNTDRKVVEPNLSYGYALCAWQFNALKHLNEAKKEKPNQKAQKVNEESLQRALPAYLGVIKTDFYLKPELEKQNKYKSGLIKYHLYFVDLKSKQILGVVSGSAENSPTLDVYMEKGDSDYKKQGSLNSDLIQNCRIDYCHKLAWLTGGKISIPER